MSIWLKCWMMIRSGDLSVVEEVTRPLVLLNYVQHMWGYLVVMLSQNTIVWGVVNDLGGGAFVFVSFG